MSPAPGARAELEGIFREALAAVDSGDAVRRVVAGDGRRIALDGRPVDDGARLLLLAAGKAAAEMAVAFEERAGARIARLLEPTCRVLRAGDLVDGLVLVGKDRPPLVLLSSRLGDEPVRRTCAALGEQCWVGYTCVLVLVPGKEVRWGGGPVPLPLEVGESGGRRVAELVASLVGR